MNERAFSREQETGIPSIASKQGLRNVSDSSTLDVDVKVVYPSKRVREARNALKDGTYTAHKPSTVVSHSTDPLPLSKTGMTTSAEEAPQVKSSRCEDTKNTPSGSSDNNHQRSSVTTAQPAFCEAEIVEALQALDSPARRDHSTLIAEIQMLRARFLQTEQEVKQLQCQLREIEQGNVRLKKEIEELRMENEELVYWKVKLGIPGDEDWPE